MDNLSIRTIQPLDNQPLADIVRETLAEFGANHPGTVYYDPTTDRLFDVFQHPRSRYFVAHADKQIFGGAGIFPSPGLAPDTAELVKMYLRPQARGLGLGRQLIERCLDFARAQRYQHIYLETMPELTRAMGIYEKFGFYYLKGPMGNTGHFGCAVWMLKDLNKSAAPSVLKIV